jgi:hypothetical protein
MMQRTGHTRRTKGDRRYYDRRAEVERRQLPVAALVRKILVTGDRNWNDIPRVVEALSGYRPGTILVHGACRGADIICAAVAETLGFEVRGYPADWKTHRKAAGPIRNQQMLTLEHRADEPIDLCLAFHNNIEESRGTRDMKARAERAGVPTELITSRSAETSSSTGSTIGAHDADQDPDIACVVVDDNAAADADAR